MSTRYKKLIIISLPYFLFVLIFNKVDQSFRLDSGTNLSAKILHLVEGFTESFQNILANYAGI